MYFIVSYDIREDNDDSKIIKAIRTYEHSHVLYSVWVIETPTVNTVEELLQNFRKYIEDDDSLFVAELSDKDSCAVFNQYEE